MLQEARRWFMCLVRASLVGASSSVHPSKTVAADVGELQTRLPLADLSECALVADVQTAQGPGGLQSLPRLLPTQTTNGDQGLGRGDCECSWDAKLKLKTEIEKGKARKSRGE
jgi:hypothetical protein